MKVSSATSAIVFFFLWGIVSSRLLADAITFGSGGNAFSIEFVDIGNPGNVSDFPGQGSVAYSYSIGKHEVSRDMINKANAAVGLGITMNSMSFVNGGPRANMPATGVSWIEAASFVNYLNTSMGFSAAYKFDSAGSFQLWESGDAGFDPLNQFRNSGANFVLPSFDEWYKAAFYDGNGGYSDYATGSDVAPLAVAGGTSSNTAVYAQSNTQGPSDISMAGGLSHFGTMGQSGNVYEWTETETDLTNDRPSSNRLLLGGSWALSATSLSSSSTWGSFPSDKHPTIGFRVASLATTAVPEPNSFAILSGLAVLSLRYRRRTL